MVSEEDESNNTSDQDAENVSDEGECNTRQSVRKKEV